MNAIVRIALLVGFAFVISPATSEPPFLPNEVLRKVISHQGVQGFFHNETIRLSAENLDSEPDVDGLQPRVILVSIGSIEAELAFQFSKIHWPSSNQVTAWFHYPPEGMSGEVRFSYGDGVAIFEQLRIWEN